MEIENSALQLEINKKKKKKTPLTCFRWYAVFYPKPNDKGILPIRIETIDFVSDYANESTD